MPRTPRRSPLQTATSDGGRIRTSPRSARVSPYPERIRTPQATPLQSGGSLTAQEQSPATPSDTTSSIYQLVVQPIVKTTVSQRDSSGDSLEDFAVNGSTFKGIIHKLWVKYGHRVKGRAVKRDDIWSQETATEAQWSKVMQLKLNNHLVDTTKTESSWNQWLVSSRGKLNS
eukprot:jgi/Phyca11/132655/e_gw1.201.5.1